MLSEIPPPNSNRIPDGTLHRAASDKVPSGSEEPSTCEGIYRVSTGHLKEGARIAGQCD
jgi:hypothetical protein